MSTISKRPSVQTLKGLFSSPKKTQARNFLRENKLSLRAIGRKNTSTNEYNHVKKPDVEHPSRTSLARHSTSHNCLPVQTSTSQIRPRSSSQQRNNGCQMHPQRCQHHEPTNVHQRVINERKKKQNDLPTKEYSKTKLNDYKQKQLNYKLEQEQQQRQLQQQKQQINANLDANERHSLHCAGDGPHIGASVKHSNPSIRSQYNLCDREIQTDDILDEDFLQKALNRCSSAKLRNGNCDRDEMQSSHSCRSIHEPQRQGHDQQMPESQQIDHQMQHEGAHVNTDYGLPLQTGESGDEQSPRSFRTVYENRQNMPSSARTMQSRRSNQEQDPGSARTHHSRMSMARSMTEHGKQNGLNDAPNNEEQLHNNMESMSLASKHGSYHQHHQHQHQHQPQYQQQQHHEQQQPLDTQSVHSRQSVHSTHTQCSSMSKRRAAGQVHKLGSRDDVRLPRYLEREKREKEEQRMREQERDPNCPPGHIALSESERLVALAGAEKKFQALVNELNHMPMTNKTLRVRTRKAEIEKELTVLEADIRAYSKPKVYIKLDEDTGENGDMDGHANCGR